MKNSFRQSMSWLHSWAGLIFGWILFPVFLTGSLSVFAPEITVWMQGVAPQPSAGIARAVELADQHLRRTAPDAMSWLIVLPDERQPHIHLNWRDDKGGGEADISPADGTLLPLRETEGGEFLVHFHAELHAEEPGLWLVAIAGLVMLVAAISGIVIHKRIFRDFFTFRRKAAAQRAWLDGHNVSAVMVLPFILVISYTGIAVSFPVLQTAATNILYDGDAAAPRADAVTAFGKPRTGETTPLLPLTSFLPGMQERLGKGGAWIIAVRNPGDRGAVVEVFRHFRDRVTAVSDHVAFDGVTGAEIGYQGDWRTSVLTWRAMVGLHLAQFGGRPMQWLYFISGLSATLAIASGLVLFTVKRRNQTGISPALRQFCAIAGRLNVTAIAGCVIAVLAFFWANRLLPPGLDGRAGLEIAAFFLVWLATVPHALLRDRKRVWTEQAGLAALLSLLLPVLNLLTTDTHLGTSLTAGLWPLAMVDIIAVISGCGLGWLACRLRGTGI